MGRIHGLWGFDPLLGILWWLANGLALLDHLLGIGAVHGVLQEHRWIGNLLHPKRHRIHHLQRIPLGEEA